MPYVQDDDFSDSDLSDDLSASAQSPVLLGVPDGHISSKSDIADVAVSRIGGHPAFLPTNEPALISSACLNCQNLCELLVQMWCPFEDSSMDRALYVWGCSRAPCQGKDGSIRAWRGLRFNEEYAKKLAQKKKKQDSSKPNAAKEKQPKPEAKLNPFSMTATQVPNLFAGDLGLGTQIFGGASKIPSSPPNPEETETPESNSDSGSEEEFIIAMASAGLQDSKWLEVPSHSPLYLSTTSEYIPPPLNTKLPAGVQGEDPLDDGKDSKNVKGTSWTLETYENSLKTDEVFDRFTKRVSYEGEQCVRYDLGGTPLPFASDKTFDSLFPLSPSDPLPITKADFKVVKPQKRSYQPTSISACPFCKSKRIFECQLMPNLINVFASQVDAEKTEKKMSDEERREAVQNALKKGGDRGMEWGTCMIFSCSKDCCTDEDGKFDALECWREEVVLVQWDV